MIATFTALLTAHLVADFILQTEWLLKNKAKLPYLLLHIAIVAATAAIAIGARSYTALAMITIITVTHLIMDYIKLRFLKDTPKAFLADQFVHIAVIALIAWLKPTLAPAGLWGDQPGDVQAQIYAGMTWVSGLIATVPFGGILIKKLVAGIAPTPRGQSVTAATGAPITPPTASNSVSIAGSTAAGTAASVTITIGGTASTSTAVAGQPAAGLTGMAKGGKYIGWLERGLTFLFVLTGKVEGVGFLLAAKSILRFGDIRDDHDRHQQEYIIIGTLLSFGWGLLVAMITTKALAYWGAV